MPLIKRYSYSNNPSTPKTLDGLYKSGDILVHLFGIDNPEYKAEIRPSLREDDPNLISKSVGIRLVDKNISLHICERKTFTSVLPKHGYLISILCIESFIKEYIGKATVRVHGAWTTSISFDGTDFKVV
jgi:hypothetical protein